ncbi:MAG TPA: ATP-binding cassette domain-containing protein [Anaeromyxobacter sp.]
MNALLEVDGIDVAYGRARVLHGVSLGVDTGERVFVVGRNGAGKTTLLKTIAGFLRPLAGSIRFDGHEISGRPPEEVAREGVRYVFQDKRVFTKLTVKENIEIAAHGAGVKLAVAIDRVAELHPPMTRFLDRMAGTLSGGQRQLLLLGRALLGEPRLLLVDEPTEGLSAGAIEEVFEVLERSKGRVAMIIVEQNLGVVRQLAHRVYAVKEGRIRSELRPAELRDQAALEHLL